VRHADLKRPPPGLPVAANGFHKAPDAEVAAAGRPQPQQWSWGAVYLMSNYDAKNGLIQWITNTLKGLGVGNDTTCWHITVAGTTCYF
jgi:hypothetical protein